MFLLSFLFDKSNVCIKEQRTNRNILTGGIKNELYQVSLEEQPIPTEINLGERASMTVWHHRLRHVNEQKTRELVNLYQITVVKKKSQSVNLGLWERCINYRIIQE